MDHDMTYGENMDVQLGYERIPHENDTDDVQTDGTDMQYNHRHSKDWND